MSQEKRSFFERLAGSSSFEDDYQKTDVFLTSDKQPEENFNVATEESKEDDDSEDGQLAVDVFQNDNEIIIQAIVAGIKPDSLDVSINKNQISIRGRRENHRLTGAENPLLQELYWGNFSRGLSLPEEVDPDLAEATIKSGILTLKIPFLKKSKAQKIKVREE